MIQFLANENFPFPSIALLRESGLVVKSILESYPGAKDGEVIQLAKKERLCILTFDRDYGELIFKYGLPDPPDVIYFRNKGDDPSFAGSLLLQLLAEREMGLVGNFTVVEEQNIRQRKYP